MDGQVYQTPYFLHLIWQFLYYGSFSFFAIEKDYSICLIEFYILRALLDIHRCAIFQLRLQWHRIIEYDRPYFSRNPDRHIPIVTGIWIHQPISTMIIRMSWTLAMSTFVIISFYIWAAYVWVLNLQPYAGVLFSSDGRHISLGSCVPLILYAQTFLTAILKPKYWIGWSLFSYNTLIKLMF